MSSEQELFELAGKLYERYCDSVGGKAFNGDNLPSWKELCADKSKVKIMTAWRDVAFTAEREVV